MTQYLQWVSRNKLLTATGGWRSLADGSPANPKRRFDSEPCASKKVLEKDSEDVNKEQMLIKSRDMNKGKQRRRRGSFKEKKKR